VKFILVVLISLIFGFLLGWGLPIYYAFALLPVILILFVYFSNPVYFIFLLLLFRPTLDPILIHIRVLNIGLGGLIGFALVFLALFSFFTKPPHLNKPSKVLLFSFLFFVLIQSISFFTCPGIVDGLKEISRSLSIVAVFALVLIHVRTRDEGMLVLKGIVLSGVLPLIIGIFYNPHVVSSLEGNRLQSVLGHPNILAFFVVILIGCVVFRIAKKYNEKDGFTNFDRVYLIGLIIALIMTKTRSAWIAFFIMMFITSLLFYRKYLVYLLVICVLAGFTPFVQQRVLNALNFSGSSALSTDQDNSFAFRMDQSKNLFQKGMEQPFWGHGWNADINLSGNNLAAHDDYVGLFVRYGIFAVFFYYFLYFYLFFLARKNLRFSKEVLTVKMSRFFIAYIPAFLIMSISENLFSYVVVHWIFWGLVAVYLVTLNLNQKEQNA
jgi:O-antigen ligase